MKGATAAAQEGGRHVWIRSPPCPRLIMRLCVHKTRVAGVSGNPRLSNCLLEHVTERNCRCMIG
jgi:hypothetical protein